MRGFDVLLCIAMFFVSVAVPKLEAIASAKNESASFFTERGLGNRGRRNNSMKLKEHMLQKFY
jgi:hypothetical protein